MPNKSDIGYVHWTWEEKVLRSIAFQPLVGEHFVGVVGEHMPTELESVPRHVGYNFVPSSEAWKLGSQIASDMMRRLAPPTPIHVGGGIMISGEYEGAPSCSSSERGICLTCCYRYANGYRKQMQLEIATDKSSLVCQLINKKILGICEDRLTRVLSHGLVCPDVLDNPKRWYGMKTEVFISYRGSRGDEATELFKMLEECGEQGVFLPRMDKVDMQPGNWMDQLMQMIDKCDVFIPLLTKDYLDGPISRPELDQALRAHFQGRQERVVPLLLEGAFEDYNSHFLGGFHIVDVRNGLSKTKFDEIVNLCLGLTRNPYE